MPKSGEGGISFGMRNVAVAFHAPPSLSRLNGIIFLTIILLTGLLVFSSILRSVMVNSTSKSSLFLARFLCATVICISALFSSLDSILINARVLVSWDVIHLGRWLRHLTNFCTGVSVFWHPSMNGNSSPTALCNGLPDGMDLSAFLNKGRMANPTCLFGRKKYLNFRVKSRIAKIAPSAEIKLPHLSLSV